MIHLVKNLRINPRPRLEDGAKLAWWSSADENSEMKMYADIAIEIAFDESSLDRFVTPEPISYLLECIMVRVFNVLNELKASVS